MRVRHGQSDSTTETGGAVNESELDKLISRAIDGATVGVSVVDVSKHNMPIVYVNKAFESITGYRSSEVLGKNCNILHGKGTDESAIAFLRRAISQQEEARVVIKNFRKDGSAFWNEMYLIPIRTEASDVTYYLCTLKVLSGGAIPSLPVSAELRYDPVSKAQNCAKLINHIDAIDDNQFVLFYVRIGGLNAVENVYGRIAASSLLVDVGQFLIDNTTDASYVFRVSEYDFCVVREGQHDEQLAIKLAKNGIEKFNQPFAVDNGKVKLSVNVGIILWGSANTCAEELLQKAELAMTMSNEVNSNNSVEIYSEPVLKQTERTMRSLADLPAAIEQKSMYVVYQPLVDSKTGQAVGCEALLRWEHSELGFISPGEFIPLAERNDWILELTVFVMEEVCKAQQELANAGIFDVVSVNLSAALLNMTGLAQRLSDVVQSAGGDCSRIEIEIVENISIDMNTQAIQNLHDFRKHQFSISVDDFGTGFSSLSYLRKIPADKIKVDKAFIDALEHEKMARLIVKSLIELCQGLGFKVVGEGVENESQRDFLVTQGCDLLQGFYYCRPKRIEDYVEYRQARANM